VSEGKLPSSPAKGVLPRTKETPRNRILTDSEIAAFWRGCATLDYPFGQIGQLLLLTAARLREVAHAEWIEFDLDHRTWTIPGARTKNGKPHKLHLSKPALAILRELAKQRAKIEMLAKSPFVFTTNGRRFTIFSWLKESIDEAMGDEFPHWTLHDLRRTAASTMARLKSAPHIVERILNHSGGTISGVAAIYNQFDYADECAHALEVFGKFVTALASPRVVPLRRA
jgi:integrase